MESIITLLEGWLEFLDWRVLKVELLTSYSLESADRTIPSTIFRNYPSQCCSFQKK
jgi:hypothetical protein